MQIALTTVGFTSTIAQVVLMRELGAGAFAAALFPAQIALVRGVVHFHGGGVRRGVVKHTEKVGRRTEIRLPTRFSVSSLVTTGTTHFCYKFACSTVQSAGRNR